MKVIDFFDFSSKAILSIVHACAVGLKKSEQGEEEHWNLIKGEYDGIDFPVVFKQDFGKKFSDILDTGWVSLYLISDRMKAILEENKLTGWQTYPIKLYDKKGVELSGYHGFSVVGHCGPVSYKKSEVVKKQFVPDGPICKYYKGQFFDEWDGTDFFMPEGTYPIFVTKKAAEVLKENKITNLKLKKLSEKEVKIDNIFIKEEEQ